MTSKRLAAKTLLAACGACLIAAPAPAQQNATAPRAQQAQIQLKLSSAERAALQPLSAAVTAKDWAAAQAALPAAAAAAQGPDARYAVGHMRLQIGVGTNDATVQAQAIDALLASGRVPAAELPNMYRNQGVLASKAGNHQKAEAAYTKVTELAPNDTDALISLAQVKQSLRKPQESLQLVQRAIELKKAAGQPVDQSWYKYALKIAFDSRLRDPATQLSRELVAAFPTKENWRDALLIYRELNTPDGAAQLDLLRLMRASNALAGERDWYDLADNLYKIGAFAEVKAVLDEGTSKRMIDPRKAAFAELIRLSNARLSGDRESLPAEETKALGSASGSLAIRIADSWMGYREYGRAVRLYRAALTKGGVDPALANIRLGMALAAAGDRAGAEAAFRAVSGPRAELAGLWLAHLTNPVR